jgi:hypothetical protein
VLGEQAGEPGADFLAPGGGGGGAEVIGDGFEFFGLPGLAPVQVGDLALQCGAAGLVLTFGVLGGGGGGGGEVGGAVGAEDAGGEEFPGRVQ